MPAVRPGMAIGPGSSILIYRYYHLGSLGQILGVRGGRDNLDGTAFAARNRAIFRAHRILAKHNWPPLSKDGSANLNLTARKNAH
jgi:hypothetical protein